MVQLDILSLIDEDLAFFQIICINTMTECIQFNAEYYNYSRYLQMGIQHNTIHQVQFD